MIFYYTLVFCAGILVSIQTALFTLLNKGLKNPALSLMAIFSIAAFATFIYYFIMQPALPDRTTIQHIPWYAWLGGVLGILYVACMILLTPKLGIGFIGALAVLGQLTSGIMIDHWGLFGVESHALTLGKILGVLFMIVGVVLIKLI